MTTFAKITIAASLLAAAASPALASSQRLTDTAYLQAVRCRALAEAQGQDVAAVSAVLKAQKGGRAPYIGDRARSMSRDAEREVARAGDYGKGQIAAELSGVCAAYLSPSSELASRR
jgi:hypothetical protein